jgi:chitin synthase
MSSDQSTLKGNEKETNPQQANSAEQSYTWMQREPVVLIQDRLAVESHPAELGRSRSLTRPERSHGQTPKRSMLAPQKETLGPWTVFYYAVTCCFPSFVLDKCGGMPQLEKQRAWREKVALCFICALMCAALGFLTFGLANAICIPDRFVFTNEDVMKFGPNRNPNHLVIFGRVYNMGPILEQHAALPYFRTRPFEILQINSAHGVDVSPFFRRELSSVCLSRLQSEVSFRCSSIAFNSVHCHRWSDVSAILESVHVGPVYYSWDQIKVNPNLMVFGGYVLDMSTYILANNRIFGDAVDSIIRSRLTQDSTFAFANIESGPAIGQCLLDMYGVGRLEAISPGCWASNLVLVISFIIVMGLVLIRFFFAVYFRWFISNQLGKIAKEQKIKRQPSRKSHLLEGKFPITMQDQSGNVMLKHSEVVSPLGRGSLPRRSSVRKSKSSYGDEVHTIMLVTCYSEDEKSLRLTFDSLANTEYNEDYKVLLIIADGKITGAGNSKSTPELILDMIELDPNWENPEALSYLAVAEGSKQHNMAKVYVGWYNVGDKSVPTVLIVKCGCPHETTKPGNRGKRDSQMILMRFLERITFNHRLCPLEYDLFQKMHYLMGVTPDFFQIVLMVDADTKVAPDSLARMVACMLRDPSVMGLCGETRIGNKNDSWVSRIQVFEYYLSHHMTKAFESMFGGVTCLPGCFCMYRIKAQKGDSWVPILASPEIISTYSQSVVDTLHKKNLLLLGEDRFLTTLMLRTFPRRKLIFVPRAYCKTTVPNQFMVLLSQRRRWINSTIHNLLELIQVNELCGIFCFSMQFVIFLELIGTVTLPAAIVFTMYMRLT